jgi:hypothetical protein
MLALFVSTTAVAVERFINRRRLKPHEVMRDVGWLALIFAAIEFAYLFIVESGTLLYGSAMRPLWYTEWGVFKSLFFEAAVAVFLILTSVWIEQTGIFASLPRISLRRPAPRLAPPTPPKPQEASPAACDVEW